MPGISVLLPCYNSQATLATALKSLFVQTYRDFEIIVVDDGSSDDTLSLLTQSQRQDARLHLVRQEHRGIIAALNCGLAHCQADIVARMDADDIAHPDRLRLQHDYLVSHATTVVNGCLVTGFPLDQVGLGYQHYLDWLNALVTHQDIGRELYVESPLAHPSVAYRRDWIMGLGGYQENGWPEDYDLWLRLYQHGAIFDKIPQYLLAWRDSPNRLSRQDARYSIENFLRCKAHYLARGPLVGRDAVIIWGAGMTGRRLCKHLGRHAAPIIAFIDIDPAKIGDTRRGLPIFAPPELPGLLAHSENPIILVAVGARGARPLIRQQLASLHLTEAIDWFFVA